MKHFPSSKAAFLLGLAVLAALPVAAGALAPTRPACCAGDARPLPEGATVRVDGGSSPSLRFCGVSCADRWLRGVDGGPGRVHVVDETTGREVPAEDAHFVRSVVARPGTGDRVHAFASRADAERHARTYAGVLLEGAERPFSGAPARPGRASSPP